MSVKSDSLVSLRYGSPTVEGEFLEFAHTVVSGVLEEDCMYRLATDADCMFALSDMHETQVTNQTGAFLPADETEYIQTSANSNILSVVATHVTASGILTATKMTPGSV